MSRIRMLAMILLPALATVFLRAVPFLLFGGKKEMSPQVKYIGNALPYAIMATLVVYCLKGLSLSAVHDSLIMIFSAVVVAVMHLWKKNTILSIAAGTAVYMFLLHL